MRTRLLVIVSISLCILGAVANARAPLASADKPSVKHMRTSKQCCAAKNSGISHIAESAASDVEL